MEKPLLESRDSVPHLDTRVIGPGSARFGFGPYAGFSSKFSEDRFPTSIFESVDNSNIVPLLRSTQPMSIFLPNI